MKQSTPVTSDRSGGVLCWENASTMRIDTPTPTGFPADPHPHPHQAIYYPSRAVGTTTLPCATLVHASWECALLGHASLPCPLRVGRTAPTTGYTALATVWADATHPHRRRWPRPRVGVPGGSRPVRLRTAMILGAFCRALRPHRRSAIFRSNAPNKGLP